MNDMTRQERIKGKIAEFMTTLEKKKKRGRKRKGKAIAGA